MASEPHSAPHSEPGAGPDSVEMPKPTAAPLVLSVGVALLASGIAFGAGFLIVGAVVTVAGLWLWISHLLPGQGHMHEELVEPGQRARPVTSMVGGVVRLREGMPGYRLRKPEDVHPISAGIKGGIVGGAVMPIPALVWSLASGHGLWYPLNLLTGMVLPGVGRMSDAELQEPNVTLILVGLVIHVIASVVLGLIYGVLMPTLPSIHRPLVWGALLMPLLWTGTSFALMETVSPLLNQGVSWPWFIFSQFLFGAVVAIVVMSARGLRPPVAGLLGGILGGLVMPLPAILWALINGHTIWYPGNLLAGMILPEPGQAPKEALEQLHSQWLLATLSVHLVMSAVFGVAYGLLLPKLPSMPDPAVWGGVVLPMLWTGTSYGLMGVINPVLQQRVNWPWFIVSQFVFGIAAAVVVHRSEMIHIPPKGRGPDRIGDFVTGADGGHP
jgi:uncharacterized membrane protein YagU involved in acid resistance